jgi:hypothetical protein
MNKYITDWVAENGTKANCAELGFAQCYLQFNVSRKTPFSDVKLTWRYRDSPASPVT